MLLICAMGCVFLAAWGKPQTQLYLPKVFLALKKLIYFTYRTSMDGSQKPVFVAICVRAVSYSISALFFSQLYTNW